MPTSVACPNPACARRSTVPDGLAGRSVRCPACNTAFTAAASHAEPERVGRFVVRAKLGAGAFGTVYRAYDPQLDREVALKVPNPGTLGTPQSVERFLREAKAAANLRHPHVVPVYDAGRDGDRYYIASAFVDGKPLAAAVDDGGIDVDRAARLTRELAEALAYAHGEGVVHRDVKPANVMLDAADRVHLMDFGLAARADEASRLTTDGAVLGTPAYLAPEHAAGEAGDPQPAADQYACGIVLYELLTGRVPFEGPVPVVLHNQVHADPEPPSAGRRAVPKDLETICLKALAKRPVHRYRDCHALADDLRRWQDGEPIAARRQTALERAVRYARKKPTAAVAVLLAVVAVGLGSFGASTWLLWQRAADARDRAAGERDETQQARDRLAGEQVRTKEALAAARAAEAAAKAAEQQLAGLVDGEKAARSQAEKDRAAADVARKAADDAGGKLAKVNAALESQYHGQAVEMAHQAVQDGGVGLARSLLAGRPEAARGWEWQFVHRLATPDRLVLDGLTSVTLPRDWAAVSPDGKSVLVPTPDGAVGAWDLGTGRKLYDLPGHAGYAASGAYSPDGASIVTVGVSGAPVVWEARTGKRVATLNVPLAAPAPGRAPGLLYPEKSVQFVDGGAQVAVLRDGVVGLYNPKTGQEVRTLAEAGKGARPAYTFAAAPKGHHLVLQSQANQAGVWDTRTGTRVALAEGSVGPRHVSADGGVALVTTSQPQRGVKVWDLRTKAEGAFLPIPDPTVIWNGTILDAGGTAVVMLGPRVVGYDARSGRKRFDLTTPAAAKAGAFSRDGTKFAVALADHTIQVHDSATGKLLTTHASHPAAVGSVVFTPGGAEVVSTSADGSVRVWALAPPPVVRTLPAGNKAYDAAFSRDVSRVATNGREAVRVRDTATGAVARSFDAPPTTLVGLYSRMAFSPDGRRVYGGKGGVLKALDVDTGAISDVMPRPGSFTRRITVSPGGDRLLDLVAIARPPAVFDARTGKQLVACQGEGGNPTVYEFSPREDRIAVGYLGGRVAVFDAATGAPVFGRDDDAGWLEALAFSPDGKRVAGGNYTGGAFVWDAATGRRVATLVGHTQGIKSVAFNPDGTRLVSAGDDRTVRVWDPATGVCVLTLRGPAAPILAARFTPDGKKLVAVDQTETITTWDPTPVNQYTDPAVLGRVVPAAPAAGPEGDRP